MKNNTFNEIAGDQIKQYRNKMGITQECLAERLNAIGFSLKQTSISRYEKGIVPVPAGVVLAVKTLAGL